jgi:hypothetical protein
MNLNDLLALSADERRAFLAGLADAAVIALADPRSGKRIRSRKQALAVIEAEAEMYAMFADAGKH